MREIVIGLPVRIYNIYQFEQPLPSDAIAKKISSVVTQTCVILGELSVTQGMTKSRLIIRVGIFLFGFKIFDS